MAMTLDEWITFWLEPWPAALGAVGIVFLASTGIGMALLKGCFRGRYCSCSITQPSRLLLPGTVLGGNLLALLGVFSGSFVMSVPIGVLWGILAIPALYGAWSWREFPWRRRKWSVLILAAAGIFTLGSALLLPYAWDELVYQVALPVRYLAEGSTAFRADNSYSGFPSYPHFLMLAGIRMGGICFPRLLVWGSYLLLFGWFYWSVRRFGRWNAVVVTAVLALSPVMLAMNRETYQEPFIALNLFAGISLMFQLRKRAIAGGIFGGFCAGMACAVKMTAGGIAAGMLILSVWLLKKRAGVWWFIAVAALAALPFYWRAFVATGNPFYPFGAGWFAPESAAALVETYHTRLGTHLYGSGMLGVLTGWVTAGFAENLYDGIILGLQYLTMLGVIIIALVSRRWKLHWSVAGLVIAAYLFWGLSSQQVRFLMPWYFLIGYLAVSALRSFPLRWRQISWGTLLVTAYFSLFVPGLVHYWRSWRVVEPSMDKRVEFLKYATQDPEFIEMLDFVGANTPADSRIMLLFERRGLYVPRRYVIGTPVFQERFFTPPPSNAAELLDELHQADVNYLLVGASSRDPDPMPYYEELNAVFALQLVELLRAGELELQEVPEGGDYTLLKVK